MAALVASLLICSMVLGPRLLEKRDDGRNDGLLRMELVPSLHSESTRSLMALGKFISTDIDLTTTNLFKTVITQFNSVSWITLIAELSCTQCFLTLL
ncbi:hypothetical protein BC829DRAFT_388644 [Chytridium lagenaria]|nr:hypothetical protein BC829DRAFT_388644 [Chytridium lagenaria]